jgi:hypothetical protein
MPHDAGAVGFRDGQSHANGGCPKVRLSPHHRHPAYFREVPIGDLRATPMLRQG